MNAIILAAGQCTRLRPYTENMPKCLLDIAGKSILCRQLDILTTSEYDTITIVTGYKHELIEEFVGNYAFKKQVRLLHNPAYMTTNNGYSLELALNALGDQPFLLLNGDVVCDAKLIYKLIDFKYRNAGACVQKKELIPEDMKVSLNPFGKIIDVAKTITKNSYGEFTGCAKFNIVGTKVMRAQLKTIGRNDWFEHALVKVIKGLDFFAVDVSQYKFIEIDTAEDLEKARGMFK